MRPSQAGGGRVATCLAVVCLHPVQQRPVSLRIEVVQIVVRLCVLGGLDETKAEGVLVYDTRALKKNSSASRTSTTEKVSIRWRVQRDMSKRDQQLMTRHWGQIAVSLTATLAVTHWLFSNGYTPLTAGLSGLITYFAVRWMVAWLYRIEYWYNKDSNRRQNCRNCGEYINRKRGDWVLKCYHCGRSAGLPGIRWLRHSVPAVQFKRTVVGPSLVIVIVATALVMSGVAGQVALSDISVPEEDDDTAGVGPSTPPANNTGPDDTGDLSESSSSDSSTTGSASDGSGDDSVDFETVREVFLELLNTERQQRGLQPLSERDVLVEMGNQQAADMAEHDYIGHEDSQGRTIEDRYRARGLLPECKLDTTGNRFYPGAENAASGYLFTDFLRWPDEKEISIESEERLAEYFVNAWMNSTPHRKVMLLDSADEAGLGLAMTDSNKIFGALEFC